MQVLVRLLRPGPDGISELQDTELETEAVTLGSAADRGIQLLGATVAPEHAVIRRAGQALSITARRGRRVIVNGQPRSRATLKIGDAVEIGGHRLTLVEPPAGFDLAIQIELNTTTGARDFESAFRTDLDQTWLSKRAASWIAFLLVPLLAFAIPLGSVLMQREGGKPPGWVPADSFWSTGALIPAHAQATGDDCGSCHQGFFTHVRDAACGKCHEDIEDHVTSAHLAIAELGPAQRCAQCHREHDATAGSMVIQADSLCTDCHGDSDVRFDALHLLRVRRFTQEGHPAFKASLLVPNRAAQAGIEDWDFVRTLVKGAAEQSNLRFSHAQHLDPDRVLRNTDSQPLGCKDCHVLAADGEHFAPVTMAATCASCHELTFDESAPNRQLPHGKPLDAMLMLEDYYARQASDPSPAVATRARRRLPDRAREEEECTDAPFACAMRRAGAEIENQFTRRGCVSCHVVTDTRARDLRERFEVVPIRLVRDYFVDTHFSHRIHSIQQDLTGDDACLSCHAARDSKKSEDLLMPDIGKCLDCHGDAGTADRVTLRCVSCHAYHLAAIIKENGESADQ